MYAMWIRFMFTIKYVCRRVFSSIEISVFRTIVVWSEYTSTETYTFSGPFIRSDCLREKSGLI